MKVVDANVLLYAVNADFPMHAPARAWLERTLSGSETLGFTWLVLLAFLRLSTRPGIFRRPLSAEESLDIIDSWLEQPCATVVHPGDAHSRILRDLLTARGSGGNMTSDAHLAAVAMEHGAELHSCDADFSRFPGLRWKNPLE